MPMLSSVFLVVLAEAVSFAPILQPQVPRTRCFMAFIYSNLSSLNILHCAL